MMQWPRSNGLRWLALAAIMCLGGMARSGSADIVSDIVGRVPSSPHSFDQVMQELAALPATGRCKLSVLGKTSEGRPIVMAEVTDFQSTYPQSTLFIIGRQHGNEAAGTESSLALLQQFAAAPTDLEKDILKYLRIVAVPVANPDGMAHGKRDNANGADLNRDWATRSQTETRVIDAAVRAERPDAVMDLHELPTESGKASYQENFLETEGSCDALPPQLSRRAKQISTALASWVRTFGYPLNVYYDYAGESIALCHRYFAFKEQYPTFLCEAKNGPGRTLPKRAGYHIIAALVVANYLMHDGAGQAPAAPAPAAVKQPDAAQPPATPQAEVKRAPAEVHVSLEPQAGGKREARLHVQVQGGEDFSYVELSVSGQTRALSNLRDNTWPLNAGSLPAGEYQVKVTAYGPGETELASRELAVKMTGDSVLAAE